MKINDIFYLIGENHKFTENYIYNNQGKYPIYSATLDKPYGYCNNFEYDQEIILIVNYGNAGKTRYINGKYNIGRNVTAIYPKEIYKDEINLKYFGIVLEKQLLSMMESNNIGAFSQSSIKEVEVEFPFPSIEEQNKIVKQYEKIEYIKTIISNKLNDLEVLLNSELKLTNYNNFKMNKIALLNKGSNKISEKMIYENYDKNGIPVYSSATEKKGLMGKVSLECYKKIDKQGKANELTWTTNGYAGKVFFRDTDYLYTEKCGRIVIRKKYTDKILPEYLCFILNQITWKYKTSENNNAKLDIIHMESIPVSIPIDENRNIDENMQKKIIKIYNQINSLKLKLENIENKISELKILS